MLEERISETNENYTVALQDHLKLETMLNEIKRLEKKPEMSESLPRILENNFVQQIKQEYSRLELQLAQISKKYKLKHPKIISIQSQIENTKKAVESENVEEIKQAMEALSQASHKLTEMMYQQAGQQQQAQQEPQQEQPSEGQAEEQASTKESPEEEVIDAEVVDEDKK